MAYKGDDTDVEDNILGVLTDIRLLLRKLVILQEEGMGFQVQDDDTEAE